MDELEPLFTFCCSARGVRTSFEIPIPKSRNIANGECELNLSNCGGTGPDSTVPTNTIQIPITTGIVTDSGSEYTGFIGVISRYIYKAGKLRALAG